MRSSIVAVLFCASVCAVFALGPFNIDKSKISVSGLSSGAFMAVQVHVAFSSQMMGAGVFAGGPYYCAQGTLEDALVDCLYGIELEPSTFTQATNNFYAQNQIDNPAHLNTSRVFLYSGLDDTVVFQAVMKVLEQYYQNYILDPSNIVTQFDISSEHCLPTDSFGNSCTTLGSPYINDCNYDGAGAALKVIYGNLNPRVTPIGGNIQSFQQATYMPSGWTPSQASLADTGYAYVPTACQNPNGPACKLHFAYHGCQQTTADIGNDYYAEGGFNGWAESNNIIVIYPQAVKSDFDPMNAEGCFDWWGYTNENYAVQSGPQMQLVANLLKQLPKN